MNPEVSVTEATGLVPVKTFDMGVYLDGVANDRSLQAQQQLVVAYDKAVRSLIGPNDVQRDGGREFKKKSAWRKLARYFNISTEIVREESAYDAEGHLVSTVVVRGVAPWGQHVEAIAKCSTRERRFGKDRSKADHDCPATAQTRASNRVISDLIAAGEVSAEEMEFGEVGTTAPPQRATPAPSTARGAADKVMPFGKAKGKRLADIPTDQLISTVDWCGTKDEETKADGGEPKFESLIAACLEVVRLRNSAVAGAEAARQIFDA